MTRNILIFILAHNGVFHCKACCLTEWKSEKLKKCINDLLPNGDGTYQMRKSLEISAADKHKYTCSYLYTTLSFWSSNLIGKCADVYYSTGTFYCLYHSWLFLFPPVDGNKLLSFWVGHWFIHSDSFKHTDSFETLFIRKCIESFTYPIQLSFELNKWLVY